MIEFTIRQLEIFVTVVEKNSFSRAAEALALAQSTVSGHIRGLEEALSLVLFVRDAKKQIRLTERGREVYALAKPIVDQCRVMSEELLVQPDARELSIAASTDAFEYLLPDLMTAYQRTHAGCRFLLVNGDSAFVHEQLRARHARIGFVGTALDRETLTYRPVCRDKLVMITPNNERYRAFQRAGAYGRDLLGEPMIVRGGGSGTRKEFDRYLRSLGRDQQSLQIVARMNQADAVASSVAGGLGVAVISEMAARRYANSGELLVFHLDAEGAYRNIYLAHRKDILFGRAEREFIEFAVAHIRSVHG